MTIDLQLYLAFVAASVVLLLIPGPNVARWPGRAPLWSCSSR